MACITTLNIHILSALKRKLNTACISNNKTSGCSYYLQPEVFYIQAALFALQLLRLVSAEPEKQFPIIKKFLFFGIARLIAYIVKMNIDIAQF